MSELREILRRKSKEELIKIILNEYQNKEVIPTSIFCGETSPLESVTKYLREYQKKSNIEVARLLNKNPAAISLAYKNSINKKIGEIVSDSENIPLKEFSENNGLSISEVLTIYLRGKNWKFSEIGKLIGRDTKTIWTFYNRAQKKVKNE
jgi:hypothetical protein